MNADSSQTQSCKFLVTFDHSRITFLVQRMHLFSSLGTNWTTALSARSSLGLLRSHLAKRGKLSGSEHFRVPSNFSVQTRCENTLNLPETSSGGCAVYQHSPFFATALHAQSPLISETGTLLKRLQGAAPLCHTSLCRHWRGDVHALQHSPALVTYNLCIKVLLWESRSVCSTPESLLLSVLY